MYIGKARGTVGDSGPQDSKKMIFKNATNLFTALNPAQGAHCSHSGFGGVSRNMKRETHGYISAVNCRK